jgi:hypothetical protein
MKREDRKVKCEGSCGWEGKMGDTLVVQPLTHLRACPGCKTVIKAASKKMLMVKLWNPHTNSSMETGRVGMSAAVKFLNENLKMGYTCWSITHEGDAVISERCSTSEGDPAVKETP